MTLGEQAGEPAPHILHTSELDRDHPQLLHYHRLTRDFHLLAGIYALRGISDGAKVFLGNLVVHMRKVPTTRVSMKTLLRITQVKRSTANRYRDELRAAQLLSWEVEGVGGTNVVCRYKLH